MRFALSRRLGGALAMLALVALTACGGGGGDDDGPQTSGLVPAAPPLGDTLAAQAQTLRPLMPGASWSYAGTDAGGVAYTSTVTHAAAVVGVTETAGNTFNGGSDSVHVAIIDGNVVQPDAIDFDGDGIADLSNAIELRSPVRVGDQVVFFDRHIANAFSDIDRDGRAESFDYAIYSQVMGNESVALGGELGTVVAVRVDFVTKGRLVLSGGGSPQPVISSTMSTWYAAGLGVVRRRLDDPAEDGVSRLVSDERLTGYSGL